MKDGTMTITQKPYGYWKIWENLEAEIRPLVKNGKFPNLQMIKHELGSYLPTLIASYGGINEVAKRMGFDPPSFHIASDGHYVNSGYEFLLDDFLWSRGIPHSVNGRVPGSNYLYDFKVNDYYIEIWGYEHRQNSKLCTRYADKRQGKEAFYAASGLKLISIEPVVFKRPLIEIESYFKNLFANLGFDVSVKEADYTIENSAKHCRFWNEDKIIEELKVFIEETGNFPSKNEMSKERADLADAIFRHGGFIYFREKLGVDLLQRDKGFWNEKEILKELQQVIDEINDFPTYEILKNRKQHDLIRAINRNGGYVYYQQLLGFAPKKAARGAWTKEVMVEGLKQVSKELGKIPTYSETRKVNKTLASAIDRSKLGFANLVKEIAI